MQLQRTTRHTNPAARKEKWHVVDAEGERLGRLATKVAGLLQGKHRPDYSRHQLSEDFVIVVNAAKIGVSGNKMSQRSCTTATPVIWGACGRARWKRCSGASRSG